MHPIIEQLTDAVIAKMIDLELTPPEKTLFEQVEAMSEGHQSMLQGLTKQTWVFDQLDKWENMPLEHIWEKLRKKVPHNQ